MAFLVALLLHISFQLCLGQLIHYYRRPKEEAKQRIALEAARRGCSAAPVMPRKGFFGFGRLIEGLRATRNDRGPQYVIEALDGEMGTDVHTAVVPMFDYDLIVSRDPVNVQAVLATQSADWDISEHRAASWLPFVGLGIFTSRGEQWKHSRALVRPQFARDQINDLDLFERHVQHLFAAIDRHRYQGGSDETETDKGWTGAFDLQPLFYNLALDVMTEMLYGYSVHSQNPAERIELPTLPGYDPPDRENIGKHMDAGKAWVETRGAFWKYRWLLPSGQFRKHCAAVHRYAEWFVQLRLRRGGEADDYLSGLQQHSTGAAAANNNKDDRYVLLHELAKSTQDPVELRSQTLNVLTAGRDTTSALLGWVFYLLCRHPRVWARLREEVLAQFGADVPQAGSRQGSTTTTTATTTTTTSTSATTSASGFGFRQVRDAMPYMHAVINETLRVAPVVPLNDRIALRDTVLPRGGGPQRDQPVFVPKGTQILIPTYALAQRPDIWGPDAAEFRPERWLENGGRKQHGFEFIPFGGGVRQCLGQQFARIKSAYVIIRMMQRYDQVANAESPPDAPMRFHHTIENRSGSGVQVHSSTTLRSAEEVDRLPFSSIFIYANKTLKGHKLLVLAPWKEPDGFLAELAAEFPDLQVVYRMQQLQVAAAGLPSEAELPEETWQDVTILLTFANLPRPEQAPKLAYVQLMSAGVNHLLDTPLFRDTEVVFCTANGVHGPQISEWIITTYLAFEHRVPEYLELQKKAHWDRSGVMSIEDAVSKTVGILGYGSIGRQTARVAAAMGMTVHAYTLHPRPTPESRRDHGWTPPGLQGDPEGSLPAKWFSGAKTEDLHAFLASGLDLLVVATPLTQRTQHLLGKAEFEVLGSSGAGGAGEGKGKGRTFVSNIARGPVIQTEDLMDALECGLIRGAALDVTDPEPLPDGHPLWKAKNVIITPHVSGASTRYFERVLAILECNLTRLAAGEELVNRVDRKRGY
ncbi:oxidoreductase-like protein [Chaetomium strumarium]|uniref:Oxidoreductase-like protein n=1 Tax=Chaetomium strumarium TaxID=1170767 RepID=A0AAJ0M282_9PEZI|nr:oxidoreductase-like protein [Chaetomium strumarium]